MTFLRTTIVIQVALLGLSAAHLQGQTNRRTTRPVVRGTRYAVSSMKPKASQVAERILRAGGNAFDAAVAGQAVLGLTDLSNNGIGSDAMLLVYDAEEQKVFSLNATGTSPKLATIDWYKKNADGKIPVNDTLLAATVPAVVDAWYLLLDRWGTMSFAQVLGPAIEMAEKGLPLNDRLARAIAGSKSLRKYPSSVETYYPGGRVWEAGELMTLPQLARTMRKLVDAEQEHASKGRRAALKAARDRFYKGDIARAMARFSEENGGLFRYEDFSEYSAKIVDAVSIDYHGLRVYKNPSNNQGPAELITLSLLEGFDLKALGHNSAEYVHTAAEAVKLAFADREKYLGDMDFIRIPFEGLFSKDYARERRKLIDPKRASLEYRPGVAEKYASGMDPIERPIDIHYEEDDQHEGDTSYICVIDKDRNVVSFTPSLHSGFGTNVVMGDLGFTLNCRGDYFRSSPAMPTRWSRASVHARR